MRYLISALMGALLVAGASGGFSKVIAMIELIATESPEEQQAELVQQAEFFEKFADRAILLAADRQEVANAMQSQIDDRRQRLARAHASRAGESAVNVQQVVVSPERIVAAGDDAFHPVEIVIRGSRMPGCR